MKVLALSDRVDPFLDTDDGLNRAREADVMLSCGDLPFDYLERLVTLLNIPFFFILGNHDRPMIHESGVVTEEPGGGINLHGRVHAVSTRRGDLLLVAGLQGTHPCGGPGSGTSELTMLRRVLRMLPRLLWNRLRYGRALDVLLSHAPPAGIHEGSDPCHRGFRVIRWAIEWLHPHLALHGHTHPTYGIDVSPATVGPTRVLNIYGSTLLKVPDAGS